LICSDQFSIKQTNTAMMSWKKKLFLATAIIVFIAVVTLIFLTPRVETEVPLPNPNGYDDFTKAGALISVNTSYWPEISVEELRAMVNTNQPALSLTRVGLTKQCRVPPYSMTATTNNHMDNLAASKRLAHQFAAASRLALIEGRTNEAALLALDCIRYGAESSRGGVIIDSLVGLAIESIGRPRLEESLPGTDAITARNIAATLEEITTQQESPVTIWKREAQWARAGRFGTPKFFTQFLQPFLQRDLKAKAEQKFSKASTDLYRTTLHAAAHAYELDHGQPPAAARDLVPQYLKSVPLDPVTGNELPLN